MTPPPAPPPPSPPPPAGDADELARLRVLYKISNILTTTQRADKVLSLILKEVVRAMRATSGSLILVDRATGLLNIEIAHNLDPEAAAVKLRVGKGVTGWVAKTGEPLCVGDTRRSPHYVKVKADVRSELAAPLIIGGEVVAVINVDSTELNAFSDADLDLMKAIAAQSARVMQVSRLYEENRHKAERLETLFNVSAAVVSEPVLEDVLRRIAEDVRRLMDVKVCSILLLDEKAESFQIKAVSGDVAAGYTRRKDYALAGSVIAEAVDRQVPLYVPDVRKEKRYRLRAVAKESGLCSLLAMPMVFLGKPIGVLNLYSAEPRVFTDEDVALLGTFAGHAAVAIVNARRNQRIARTEQLLREADKFSILGELAAEIAHEVRNPLTILSMLVHTVSGDDGLSKASRRDLGVMGTKLRHINKIVDQVLDFSRARAPVTALADVNAIVEDVCMLVDHKAASMGFVLERRAASNLPPARVNPGQIDQAVLNLALNGLEVMREPGSRLRVETAFLNQEGADWVAIRVRDEGPGIPEEKLQKIFQPFFTMREKGTGLGLYITRRIVEQHGGRLTAKSREGKGAMFEILLPAAANGETS